MIGVKKIMFLFGAALMASTTLRFEELNNHQRKLQSAPQAHF
jgi:hypothetical protein